MGWFGLSAGGMKGKTTSTCLVPVVWVLLYANVVGVIAITNFTHGDAPSEPTVVNSGVQKFVLFVIGPTMSVIGVILGYFKVYLKKHKTKHKMKRVMKMTPGLKRQATKLDHSLKSKSNGRASMLDAKVDSRVRADGRLQEGWSGSVSDAIDQLFDQYDTDRNGHITEMELLQLMIDMAFSFAENKAELTPGKNAETPTSPYDDYKLEDASWVMKCLDADANGQLEKVEFMKWVRKGTNKSDEELDDYASKGELKGKLVRFIRQIRQHILAHLDVQESDELKGDISTWGIE